METCFECGEPAVHDHHVVPQAQGGTQTVPLCMVCHGKAHGIDGVTLGFGTAHPPHVMDCAAEMYEAGWSLDRLASFWTAAGLKPLRGKALSSGTFLTAFRKRGVVIRPLGRPRKQRA